MRRARRQKPQLTGFHITADPAEGTIMVNGITYLGIVFVQNGRTYVPLRLLVTQLGGGVAWDPYLAEPQSPHRRRNTMPPTCIGSAASSVPRAGENP